LPVSAIPAIWLLMLGSRDSLAVPDNGEQPPHVGSKGNRDPSSHAVAYLLIALQLGVALGILNVWLLRPRRATPFRGGAAKTLTEEFAAYGLPFWFMCVVGVLKVGLAVALIAAIWFHPVAQPAALGLGLLMLGALFMHLKVKDPIKKSLPALGVFAMCTAIALL